MREVREPLHLATAASDGVKNEPSRECEQSREHHAGGKDRSRDARHQAGRQIGLDDRHGELTTLVNLGYLVQERGDLETAQRHLTDARVLAQELGDRNWLTNTNCGMKHRE